MALTVISLRKPKGGVAGSGDSGRMRSVRVECYVRVYHVYQRIWNPFVGEVAIALWEERNTHDSYAVDILEEDTCCSVGLFEVFPDHA